MNAEEKLKKLFKELDKWEKDGWIPSEDYRILKRKYLGKC